MAGGGAVEADMENCRKVSSEKPGFATVLSGFEVFLRSIWRISLKEY